MQRTQSPKFLLVDVLHSYQDAVDLAVIGLFTEQLFYMIFKLEKVSFMPSAYYFFLKKKLFCVIPQNSFFAAKGVRPIKHV